MKVKELMSKNPVVCNPQTNLQNVAKLMYEADCGAIPVVRHDGIHNRAIGIITDRDIVMRSLARGRDPIRLNAEDCMTRELVTVNQDSEIDECIYKMEKNHIRRMLVVNQEGDFCGIVSQADIALKGPTTEVPELLREVSRSL